jgi:hypothetical protein
MTGGRGAHPAASNIAATISDRNFTHPSLAPLTPCARACWSGRFQAGKNKITLMQPCKDMPVHPFTPDYYVGGRVYVSGRSSSIMEITSLQLQQFTSA